MGSGRLKPGWTLVAFGDVVRRSTERSSNPEAAGVDRYVGLEHLNPGELTIRRWGDVGGGTTFTSIFRPGHVLFGKRRAYLRKVAAPDFSGVCSGDIYVLESRDKDYLLPGLLPFLCQTDAFFEHAIGTSAGSLSPRTNWQNLATYEFVLPPLDEQRRIARVMLALQTTGDRYRSSREALQSARAALVDSIYSKELSAYPVTRLADFSDVCYGLTIGPSRRLASTKMVPYLRVANVLRGSVDLSEVKTTNELSGDAKYRLHGGDVLIVEGHANPLEIGRACVWAEQLPDVLHQNHVIRARCDESAFPHYVCVLINSPYGRKYFRSQAKSTSGLNTINSTVVKDYSLPLPPQGIQRSVLDRLRAFDGSADRLLARQRMLDSVSKRAFGILDGQPTGDG